MCVTQERYRGTTQPRVQISQLGNAVAKAGPPHRLSNHGLLPGPGRARKLSARSIRPLRSQAFPGAQALRRLGGLPGRCVAAGRPFTGLQDACPLLAAQSPAPAAQRLVWRRGMVPAASLPVGHRNLWAAESAGNTLTDRRSSEFPFQVSLGFECSYHRTTTTRTIAACIGMTSWPPFDWCVEPRGSDLLDRQDTHYLQRSAGVARVIPEVRFNVGSRLGLF